MDLRRVDEMERPDFLHELNVQLQAYLDAGALAIQDMVVRRA